ncbi:MAG TPA: dynamin family protein [Bryobacteraceae bacterium]|nr:dynamin family protein [Bryobacteraceae bacterium]
MAEHVPLNEAHKRRLLSNARHADQLLSEIEAILDAAESRSIFPKFRLDVSPAQARLIRNHVTRIREHLGRALRAVGVHHEGPSLGALHSIRVTLAFIRVAAQEMAPRYLRGYGQLPEWASSHLQGLTSELEGLLDNLDRSLAEDAGADLRSRLDRLAETAEVEWLRLLEEIISRHGLAELRPRLANLVERLESHHYEIALFGRVNTGKSSLLNRLLGTTVLPVGVTPVTAVPTRLVWGAVPRLTVSFADRRVEQYALEELPEFVTEERNPSNRKAVARIIAELPAERLQNGLVFVDTPGLGSLAAAGAAETLAYLPHCDLGVLLVSAVSPLNEEDLTTLRALYEAGIPAMVLLSKADLLSPDELRCAVSYTAGQIRSALPIEPRVHAVSALGSHAALLDKWAEQEIAPLYARHRDLLADSLRRKAQLLGGATAAALEVRLHSAVSAPERDRLIAAEAHLRQTAGQLEEARSAALRAADQVRRLAAPALDAAAEAWAADLSSGERRQGNPLTAEAVSRLAAASAAEIYQAVTTLARDLAASLNAAAQALRRDDAPAESELLAALGPMPPFDLRADPLPVKRPLLRWPRRLAVLRLRRKLSRAVGPHLEQAFTAYSRLIGNWVSESFAELRRRFDAHAEPYRAQLAVLVERQTVSPEQREALRADLERLRRGALAGGSPWRAAGEG